MGKKHGRRANWWDFLALVGEMKKAQYACDHAQSAQEREQALILYRGFKSQAKRLRIREYYGGEFHFHQIGGLNE